MKDKIFLKELTEEFFRSGIEFNEVNKSLFKQFKSEKKDMLIIQESEEL